MQFLTNPPGFKQQFYSLLGSVIKVVNFEYSVQVVIGTIVFFLLYQIFAVFYFHMSSQFSDVKKPDLTGCFRDYLTLSSTLLSGVQSLKDIKLSNYPKTIKAARFLFHLVASVVCFRFCQDEKYWPSFLGGNGSIQGIFEGFPNIPETSPGRGSTMAHFWWLLIVCLFQKNIMAGFTAYIIFVLYMMNSARVFLVLSFILNACHVWSSLDSIFLEAQTKSLGILKVFSGALNLGMHVILKVIAYGVIMGYFWAVLEDCGSWIIWFEMASLRMILTCFWGYYVYHLKDMMNELKSRLEKKRENDKMSCL